jgi:hypothetical protein
MFESIFERRSELLLFLIGENSAQTDTFVFISGIMETTKYNPSHGDMIISLLGAHSVTFIVGLATSCLKKIRSKQESVLSRQDIVLLLSLMTNLLENVLVGRSNVVGSQINMTTRVDAVDKRIASELEIMLRDLVQQGGDSTWLTDVFVERIVHCSELDDISRQTELLREKIFKCMLNWSQTMLSLVAPKSVKSDSKDNSSVKTIEDDWDWIEGETESLIADSIIMENSNNNSSADDSYTKQLESSRSIRENAPLFSQKSVSRLRIILKLLKCMIDDLLNKDPTEIHSLVKKID